MLNIKSYAKSLNIYDFIILFFINLAILETLSYSFGIAVASSPQDLVYSRLIFSLIQKNPRDVAVIFLHFFMVSLSTLAAIRFPVKEDPDLKSAIFEAFNGAVFVAFINIFLVRQDEKFFSNLMIAITAAFIFFFCRWILPKSPLKVRVPFAGVLLSFLWLFSVLIVVRYYMNLQKILPDKDINDIGIFKDAFFIWAILFMIGLIPQLVNIKKKFHIPIFTFVGIITLMALFFEFQYPLLNVGRNMAGSILKYKKFFETPIESFVQSMLWHVIVRSFVFLFLGVVMVFAVGFLRRGAVWFKRGKKRIKKHKKT